MSFSCEHCGYQNNEIQPGGKIADGGVRYTLVVDELPALSRQIVKSDYASIRIPELDFEIAKKSQNGGTIFVLFKTTQDKICTTLGYIFNLRCFTKRLQSKPLN